MDIIFSGWGRFKKEKGEWRKEKGERD